ncbi:MAG: ferrochelatase, partial [Kangiellaceae bacterium]
MTNKAILLCNLGSPDKPDVPSVRAYLNQFLMDPSVIQLPWLIRRLIVSLFVLPNRPKKSAHAYQQVWTEHGSPLLVLSEQLREKVQNKVQSPVYMAMRYGNPSIENQVLDISKNKSIKEILFIPLYPHYAESTVETSIIELKRIISLHNLDLKIKIKKPFYNESKYVEALVNSYKSHINNTDKTPHLLFSYHGLPELHLTKLDPTKDHCLKKQNCCEIKSDAHATCYRHHVMETTRLFVENAGIGKEQYSIAFQSRLGRAKWLEPSTNHKLKELINKNIKDVVVICPAFVTDCLETLEEIAISGKEEFLAAGGNSLQLIPCLNSYADWVDL